MVARNTDYDFSNEGEMHNNRLRFALEKKKLVSHMQEFSGIVFDNGHSMTPISLYCRCFVVPIY